MKTQIHAALLTITVGAAILCTARGEAGALEIAAGVVKPDGALVIVFWDGGVPENQSIDYTLSSTGTAVFVCGRLNRLHVLPNIRATVTLSVLKTSAVASSSAGEVDGIIEADPPKAPLLACPFNYAPRLASVSYDAISLGSKYGNQTVSGLSWDPIPL